MKKDSLSKISSIAKSKLTKRFTFHVVRFSLIIALLISGLAIYKNYQDDISALKKDLAQIEQSIKGSLAYNMWVLDINALKNLTNDLLLNKNIVYVAIFDENGNLLIEKGKKTQEHVINRTLPIYYKLPNEKKIYLGKLVYTATTYHIYEKYKHLAFSIIGFIFVFFLFLSVVIVYIYWNSTVKYILAIKEYTDKFRRTGFKAGFIEELVIDKPYKDEKDELDELIDTINEMQREIVEKYAELEYLSYHDELTGLPNRRMIKKLISNTIRRCKEQNGYSALLYIDLDQFKLINDSMGHSVGDKILIEISNRLKSVCKKGCYSARISGDEFLILQKEVVPTKEEARKIALEIAQKILFMISKDIVIDGSSIKMTTGIGIAIFGGDSDPEIVIKQADNALYRAKEKGRNQIVFFSPKMQKIIDKRLHIEQLIKVAVEKDLFFMVYQPKYNYDHKIYSAEALLRLRDENGGIVSPADFIPIAEESSLIIKIGDYVFEKVFEFIKNNKLALESSGIQNIAINVSPTQYCAPKFAEKVIGYAKQFGIDPHFVILEITEEVVAGSIDTVLDVMNKLKKHGFKFSIDDFGTGYSSMRYLKNLPLDELKIDKSFIDDILEDEKTAAIVKTIIEMAQNLKIDVIAEGVENEEQVKLLYEYGCRLFQGYYFSKPLKENEFLKKLKSNKKTFTIS